MKSFNVECTILNLFSLKSLLVRKMLLVCVYVYVFTCVHAFHFHFHFIYFQILIILFGHQAIGCRTCQKYMNICDKSNSHAVHLE
jgi:hypothetical protein